MGRPHLGSVEATPVRGGSSPPSVLASFSEDSLDCPTKVALNPSPVLSKRIGARPPQMRLTARRDQADLGRRWKQFQHGSDPTEKASKVLPESRARLILPFLGQAISAGLPGGLRFLQE